MAQVSKVWLDAHKTIDEFKAAFEKKYGFGLMIYVRSSKLLEIPPISLDDLLEEVNQFLFELYPSKIIYSRSRRIVIDDGIKIKCRAYELLVVRQIFCYIALELGYGSTEIARYLDLKHSTILSAKKSLDASFASNYKGSLDKYQALKNKILIKFSNTQ